MGITARDYIEKKLLEAFPQELKPIGLRDREIFSSLKDGSFGFSYLAFMLYANGYNKKARSTRHPQGLRYFDGSSMFGVGFFFKHPDDPHGYLHIIAPHGKNWLTAVDRFIQRFRSVTHIQSPAYVRHIHKDQYKALILAGYQSIDSDPWDVASPSEDETYNHRLVRLDDIVGISKQGVVEVKTLHINEHRAFRRKTKLAYNRFVNFLNRNNAVYRLEPYQAKKHEDIARRMIIEHFASLTNALGSTPEDYFSLIHAMPDVSQREFFGRIGYLAGHGENIPVTLFLGEAINDATMALYATFALRNNHQIFRDFDAIGYSAISQYAYIHTFILLQEQGFTYADLGGSEVEDLDTFKRQLGAGERKTFWAVKPQN